MDKSVKVIAAVVLLLVVIPVLLTALRRYTPALQSSLGMTAEAHEQESIRRYVEEQFFEHVRTHDDITTTELRSAMAKGSLSISTHVTQQEASGMRYYGVDATLTHNGIARGTAYGTATPMAGTQSTAPQLTYDIQFEYKN